jgi:hypothetical protein
MAIDTAAKRASAMGVGCPWLPLVQPDASKPESWRAAAAFVYGGNALSAPVAYGQLCVPASQFYFPGSLAGQIYSPGAYDQETYSPGATESQIGCC